MSRKTPFARHISAWPVAVMVAFAAAVPSVHAQQPPLAGAGTPAQSSGPALRLSMDEAVAMAMESSLGLKQERLNLDISSSNIASARSAFLPLFTSSLGTSTRKSAPSDFTQGESDISNTSLNGSGTVRQALPWFGSGYSVQWSGNRNAQKGGVPTFAPLLGSSLSFNFSQPLWRDLGIDGARAGLETTERQRVITDLQLQERMVNVETAVRNAYLTLVFTIENLKVAEQNRALAQELLRGANARVAVGQSAPVDVIQAQASVASNEDFVIQAQSAIYTAEDALRSLILDPARPDYWQVHLEPIDTITNADQPIDVEVAIRNALANRLDLMTARRSLEITDLNLRVSRNATLPQLDLNVGYSAQGTGGTRISYEGFPPVEVGRSAKSFGSTLADTFSGAYPSWSVGVSVDYPIGRTAAEASLARQQVARRQQQISLQSQEIEVVRAVRDAARQVETARLRVRATEESLKLAQQQLDAQNRMFEVGLSSSFELQSRQSQLAAARNSALNATIALARALIRFETVQKVQ